MGFLRFWWKHKAYWSMSRCRRERQFMRLYMQCVDQEYELQTYLRRKEQNHG